MLCGVPFRVIAFIDYLPSLRGFDRNISEGHDLNNEHFLVMFLFFGFVLPNLLLSYNSSVHSLLAN